MKKAKKTIGGTPGRRDGRRALLVYFRPEITTQLKRAALEFDRPAYKLVEEAVQAWLKRHSKT
jgi:hypothetical protein